MKIALAQINSTTNVEDNLSKVERYSAEAARQKADVIVFPEATMVAFGADLPTTADEFSETWTLALRRLSADCSMTIIVGEFERVVDKVTNYLAAYFPDESRTRYAKIHLYDAFGYKESDSVKAGNQPVLLEVAGTVIGLATCYDIRFPKLFAELSRQGAAMTVVSASWGAGPGKVEQWQTLARARALDSNTFIIAVDQADPKSSGVDVPDGAPTGVGHSIVADPFGHVIAELDGKETLKVIDLDPALSIDAARAIPVLENAKLGY